MSEKTDMQVEESKTAYSTALPEQKAFFPPQQVCLWHDPPRADRPVVDKIPVCVPSRSLLAETGPADLSGVATAKTEVSERRRMLPSECIDLIYIDPPFFSGRNYNIIFGDLLARNTQASKNEVRSFTDIWEGGMPGYLIWVNARLYDNEGASVARLFLEKKCLCFATCFA